MEERVFGALKKCAVGLKTKEVVEEFSVEDGELKLVKKKVTRRDIPPDIKSARLHRLLKASSDCAEKYISRFLGTEREIIAEELENGYTSGYTDNYIRVYIKGSLCVGEKLRVKLTDKFKDGVLAVNER